MHAFSCTNWYHYQISIEERRTTSDRTPLTPTREPQTSISEKLSESPVTLVTLWRCDETKIVGCVALAREDAMHAFSCTNLDNYHISIEERKNIWFAHLDIYFNPRELRGQAFSENLSKSLVTLVTLWRWDEKAKRPMCPPCLFRVCPALCFVAFSRPDGSGTQRVRVKTRSTRLQERLLVSGMTVCRTRPRSTRWSWAPNIAFRDAIFMPQRRKNMAVVTTCNNVTSITRYFQRFSKLMQEANRPAWPN